MRNKAAGADALIGLPTSTAVRLAKRIGSIAFLLPKISKDDFFRSIVMDGVLPRKTFSMGHAWEKRYYIECRRITEE